MAETSAISPVPAAVAAAATAHTSARFPLFATAAAALELVLNRPSLWLYGTAGFLLRGGIVLLLLPLVALPSPVEIRLLLGDGLGSTGFSGGLIGATTIFGLLAAVVSLVAMLGLAWLELWTYVDTAGASGARLAGAERRRVVSQLFIVQVSALLLIGAAVLPLIAQATSVAYQEIIRPTGSGPLYSRILAGVGLQAAVLVVAIFAAELLSAVVSRRILARALMLPTPARRGRWRPLVAAMGWLVTLAVLGPTLWALAVVWRSVSSLLLGSSGSASNEAMVAIGVGIMAAVWASAMALAGFAATLRGALWTMQELR